MTLLYRSHGSSQHREHPAPKCTAIPTSSELLMVPLPLPGAPLSPSPSPLPSPSPSPLPSSPSLPPTRHSDAFVYHVRDQKSRDKAVQFFGDSRIGFQIGTGSASKLSNFYGYQPLSPPSPLSLSTPLPPSPNDPQTQQQQQHHHHHQQQQQQQRQHQQRSSSLYRSHPQPQPQPQPLAPSQTTAPLPSQQQGPQHVPHPQEQRMHNEQPDPQQCSQQCPLPGLLVAPQEYPSQPQEHSQPFSSRGSSLMLLPWSRKPSCDRADWLGRKSTSQSLSTSAGTASEGALVCPSTSSTSSIPNITNIPSIHGKLVAEAISPHQDRQQSASTLATEPASTLSRMPSIDDFEPGQALNLGLDLGLDTADDPEPPVLVPTTTPTTAPDWGNRRQRHLLNPLMSTTQSVSKLRVIMGDSCPLDVSLREVYSNGLVTLLESRLPVLYFMAMLLSQQNAEALFFISDVRDFEQRNHRSYEEQAHEARTIFNAYFVPDSPLEINITHVARRKAAEGIKRYDRLCFQEATLEIAAILESEVDRFRRGSSFYQRMMQDLGNQHVYGERQADEAARLLRTVLASYESPATNELDQSTDAMWSRNRNSKIRESLVRFARARGVPMR
ncbi:uncharacterized protein BJ171DRAFT_476740 [Polychytrium aggregatum]|uniref:uncharacterized protein n=1 Tax=Polychytrium aggregatum TaxID=110093 RepID=UPI0022FE7137|nr:uncharacterized protein BJ171DRAFT_476740 [Polychytrium aggregatum]KAI9202306.1 hypothetical protein BJ171DRAFT_476740 [Polychytrium aggregatum]